MSPITQDITEIRADLNLLYKTIYQGNGTPSIVSQISKLDHRMTTLEDKLDRSFKSIDNEMSLKFKNITDVVNEKFNHISYQISQEFEKKRNDSTSKWSFKGSVFTASIAGICSIIAIIVAEFAKRF